MIRESEDKWLLTKETLIKNKKSLDMKSKDLRSSLRRR